MKKSFPSSLWGVVLFFLSMSAFADDPLRPLMQPFPEGSSGVGPKILFLGDSLTEGYGIAKEKSFPVRAVEKLNAKFTQRRMGIRVEGIYGGISGSTTASGPSRLKWFLKAKPKVLFLALGANDGLRGLPVTELEKNLDDTLKIARDAGLVIVLAGMKVPPNYGKKAAADYEAAFSRLAKKYDAIYMPFLLEGVGGEKDMNQEDGVHPNEKGHAKIAEAVVPYLEKALKVPGSEKGSENKSEGK